MSDALLPCPSCSRHVRASEAACPFCATAIPESLRSQPRRRSPSRRLSRAALLALGTSAVALAAAACGGDEDSSIAPLYGAPAMDGAIDHKAADADPGFDGSIAPMYGAAPTDSGAIEDAADADAADARETSVGPVYGAPPKP